jgi:uncharacterized protein YecA (UPF0149 family)
MWYMTGIAGVALFLVAAFYVVRQAARNVPPRRRRHGLNQIRQAIGHRFGISGGFYPDDVIRREGVPQIGRNDPCHCGSGKKYKRCCGREPAK